MNSVSPCFFTWASGWVRPTIENNPSQEDSIRWRKKALGTEHPASQFQKYSHITFSVKMHHHFAVRKCHNAAGSPKFQKYTHICFRIDICCWILKGKNFGRYLQNKQFVWVMEKLFEWRDCITDSGCPSLRTGKTNTSQQSPPNIFTILSFFLCSSPLTSKCNRNCTLPSVLSSITNDLPPSTSLQPCQLFAQLF